MSLYARRGDNESLPASARPARRQHVIDMSFGAAIGREIRRLEDDPLTAEERQFLADLEQEFPAGAIESDPDTWPSIADRLAVERGPGGWLCLSLRPAPRTDLPLLDGRAPGGR